jgi:hypothetical protein
MSSGSKSTPREIALQLIASRLGGVPAHVLDRYLDKLASELPESVSEDSLAGYITEAQAALAAPSARDTEFYRLDPGALAEEMQRERERVLDRVRQERLEAQRRVRDALNALPASNRLRPLARSPEPDPSDAGPSFSP